MAKEASYVTLARFSCHLGNKKFGGFRKNGHFSLYCLNGNENASTDNKASQNHQQECGLRCIRSWTSTAQPTGSYNDSRGLPGPDEPCIFLSAQPRLLPPNYGNCPKTNAEDLTVPAKTRTLPKLHRHGQGNVERSTRQ